MSPPCDSCLSRFHQRKCAAEKLHEKPDNEEDICGYIEKKRDEKNGNNSENPAPWEEAEIGSHNPRRCSRCSYYRSVEIEAERELYEICSYSPDEEISKESRMSETILDVVSEYKENPQVYEYVCPSSVYEHRTQDREKVESVELIGEVWRSVSGRNESIGVQESQKLIVAQTQ